MKYSDDLEIYSGKLPLAIEEALSELRQFLKGDEISVLKYSDSIIVIPLEVDVNLPSKGTSEGIDIRSS